MEREQLRNKSEFDKLPIVIDQPYPFMAIGDISCVLQRITPGMDGNAQIFQDEIYSILNKNMPKGSTFYSVSSDFIDSIIERRVRTEIGRQDKKVGIANLDRYLCRNIQGDTMFRINISRNINGGLVARPGEKNTPETQIENLIAWSQKNEFKELIIVDDVIAFGDTMVPFIEIFKKSLPNTDIRILVGIASSGGAWSGIETVIDKTGVKPEYAIQVNASAETIWSLGMALPTSRDFTVFGGKVTQTDGKQLSFPYFLPYSIPVASFMPQENQLESARQLMQFNKKMVNSIGRALGRDLTISDLINSGFGIPYTKIECLKNIMKFPDINDKVIDYLKYSESILESNLEQIQKEALEKK